jgi:hypothetical protein
MPLIPFAEWRPDVSSLATGSSPTIKNVIPRGDGYGPFRSLSSFTQALPDVCRGGFVAIAGDNSIAIFAATATRLYKLNNTNMSWTHVSKGLTDYSAVPAREQWQFAQFGNNVIAVQANVPPQVFDLSSSSQFTDLGGTPPNARYVSVVGRFLVLSGLLANPRRMQWSGLNAITTWTPGVDQSDFQDFPDGGVVRGVAGGEYGYIFQDSAIRRMIYAPGSPVIFQIERIADDKGLYAPYSLIRAGELIFFFGSNGFYMIEAGGFPQPIGKEKIDRTVLAELDANNLQLMLGAADPRSMRVFFSYKSSSGASGLFNKLLCYDWITQRFTLVDVSGEYLLPMSQPGVTLEGLDSISSSIDALTDSLDNFDTILRPEVAAFASDHTLGFFRGSSLEATLETAEQGASGARLVLRSLRPLTDATSAYISVGKRMRPSDSVSYSNETALNARGFCPQRLTTYYARAKLRIPAGASWTFATGVEPDFVIAGGK